MDKEPKYRKVEIYFEVPEYNTDIVVSVLISDKDAGSEYLRDITDKGKERIYRFLAGLTTRKEIRSVNSPIEIKD